MSEAAWLKIETVVCPTRRADFLIPDIERWSMRRQAEVLALGRAGLIFVKDISFRQALHIEELARSPDRYALTGVRATQQARTALANCCARNPR